MLIFLPPIVQIFGGIVLLGAGVALHSGHEPAPAFLDALGALTLVVGGIRWRRQRRDG